jgi:hypothetical protein
MKIFIKNMVCNTCKLKVIEALERHNLPFLKVDLGEAEIFEDISKKQREQLQTTLLDMGFELLSDKKTILVEKVKNVIVEMVHHHDNKVRINFSYQISEKLNYDYTYISNLFTELQGTNIQHFLLLHKVERVKELISYGELTISEIADKLNYCNVAHLSTQFKKITGLSPSQFKNLPEKRRNAIDSIQ